MSSEHRDTYPATQECRTGLDAAHTIATLTGAGFPPHLAARAVVSGDWSGLGTVGAPDAAEWRRRLDAVQADSAREIQRLEQELEEAEAKNADTLAHLSNIRAERDEARMRPHGQPNEACVEAQLLIITRSERDEALRGKRTNRMRAERERQAASTDNEDQS